MVSFHRSHPFFSLLKEKKLLTKNSEKETFHLVFDIRESCLAFRPGDCAAILPKNDPFIVEKTLSLLHATGEEKLQQKNDPTKEISLKEFLTDKANISKLPSSFLDLLFKKQNNAKKRDFLHKLLLPENSSEMIAYLHSYELWDLLEEHSEASLSFQEVSGLLLPLSPRFYSIASSQKMFPDEIHLIVTKVLYQTSGRLRKGVATNFLCHLAKEKETKVPLYIQPSHSFLLPEDPKTPIILVGPGTGIAPFRSFLQERKITQAPGKNWLFFGERHRHSEFYYEAFLTALEKEKFLRLDLAFSRDQKEKIYVHHRMLERAKELWAWLQEGALFYVCGSSKMAEDVEDTLRKIAKQEGHLREEDAYLFLKQLKIQKRYRRDVY